MFWRNSHRLFRFQVKELNHHREGHREINVTFRNMLFEGFRRKRNADQEQESQGQHFHRRMFVHEITNGSSTDHHYYHGDDHRRNHHFDMIGHTYSSNDGVE